MFIFIIFQWQRNVYLTNIQSVGVRKTSCAHVDTICRHPLQVDNIFTFIRQVAPVLIRHVGYLRHQRQVDLWPWKGCPESRVTWATAVPILVFLGLSVLELRPMYVTDRYIRQKHQLMPPPYGDGGINMQSSATWCISDTTQCTYRPFIL